MKYISTRGQAPELNFEQVLLTGLASDGGLYVPDKLPQFSAQQIADFAKLSYQELAFEVMSPFVGDTFSATEFKDIIAESYSGFRHQGVAPLKQLGHNEWVLELFHGPTLAFKDFALQLLGRMLDAVLKKQQKRVVIMGATSGDTGSAAIEGCRHSDHVDIFILHPHQRVSDVQRKQMTTVDAGNVFNLAIEGNFDDCQAMVKASFADQSFLNDGRQLVAVNSINWARIMAQVVYYFYAAVAVGSPHREVNFSVPTGNFGDIFAGFIAKKMGLPIKKLVIATNGNDILHRILVKNTFKAEPLKATLSPSMDITVSSNFERLLFDLFAQDGKALADFMQDAKLGHATLSAEQHAELIKDFTSFAVNDEQTCQMISSIVNGYEYLLDPHSAIGLAAMQNTGLDQGLPNIALATAHPAKFNEAITRSGCTDLCKLPAQLDAMMNKKERYTVLENDLDKVKAFISTHHQ